MKKNQILAISLIIIFLNFYQAYNLKSSQASTDQKDATSVKSESSSKNKESFIMRGWLKFFTYIPIGNMFQQKIDKFEYNSAWVYQLKNNSNVKDEYGQISIPDDTHFFFLLNKKALFATSSRQNDLAGTERSLLIEWLEPIVIQNKDESMKGGMEDLGNFKEGFCWRLKSKTNVVWNLCADTQKEKKLWMNSLKSLMQIENEESSGYEKQILQQLQQNQDSPFQIMSSKIHQPQHNNSVKQDGKWITIQDWGQCTLACGGGKQYKQRLCIPPKNGGRDCDGPTVLERECNTQNCPDLNQQTEEETHHGELSPIVKVRPISDRPQRYEVCIVKEGNLNMVLNKPGFDFSPQFPVQVVLNNRTFSIFGNPSYDSVFLSFDLQYILIKPSLKYGNGCFVVEDQRDIAKSVPLCIMPAAVKQSETIDQAKEEWIKDIYFFRDQCKERPKYVDNDPLIERQRLMIEQESQDNAFSRIKEKEEDQREIAIEQRVEQEAGLALKNMQKELKYEQLALKEELMREQQEEMEIQNQILEEESKKQQMERRLKQKQSQQKYQDLNTVAQSKILAIQKTAAQQVQNSRAQIYKKINAMRKAFDRKRKTGKQRIREIRVKLASEFISDNKKGDARNCSPSQDETFRKNYCKNNFESDFERQGECLQGGYDYCFVCCENEYGYNYQDLRNQCFEQCDLNSQDQANCQPTNIKVRQ